MADAAATVTRCCKLQEYPVEDVDRLAFLPIMTSARSLGCCRIKIIIIIIIIIKKGEKPLNSDVKPQQ